MVLRLNHLRVTLTLEVVLSPKTMVIERSDHRINRQELLTITIRTGIARQEVVETPRRTGVVITLEVLCIQIKAPLRPDPQGVQVLIVDQVITDLQAVPTAQLVVTQDLQVAVPDHRVAVSPDHRVADPDLQAVVPDLQVVAEVVEDKPSVIYSTY